MQHFAAAGLRSRAVHGSPDRWRLQTQERYRRIRPSLVTVDHLAGPAIRGPDVLRKHLYRGGNG